MIKQIKEQIDRQTRPKIGNVNIETTGSTFKTRPDGVVSFTKPVITWDRVWYTKNRGSYANMTPDVFNNVAVQKSTQIITTVDGNFKDSSSTAYYNARYSGWTGKRGGGRVTFRIIASTASVSVWVDNKEVLSSGDSAFQTTDINIYISDKSFIQIFFYSETANNQFTITGNMIDGIDQWAQGDVTPFLMPVVWYPDDPLISNSLWQNGWKEYNKLKWWFGQEWEIELLSPQRTATTGSDFGGFGIWNIEFLDIGKVEVLSEDWLLVDGFYLNIKYWRIDGIIIESTFNTDRLNRTHIYSPGHGLTWGNDDYIIEAGTIKHIFDMPIDSFTDLRSGIFETYDMNIERGKTYYYLIDTYDTSANKNRGTMTGTYQTIVAGDVTPPNHATNVVGYFSTYDSITVEYDLSTSEDAIEHNIWTDIGTTSKTITGGTYEYCFIDSEYAFNVGDPISIEYNSIKYTRRIEDISPGLVNTYTRKGGTLQPIGGKILYDTSLPVEAVSGTVRLLTKVSGSWQERLYTAPPAIPLPFDQEPV